MPKAGRADVIVVGAGLSGLTAARLLSREGLEVLVLEARGRPGGRTQTIEVGGVSADLGGEWVDEAHAELRSLCGDLGLRLVPSARSKEGARWYLGGAFTAGMPLSARDAEVYRRMNEALVEVADGVDLDEPWRGAPPAPEDASVDEWLREAGMSEDGRRTVETLISSCGSTVPPGRMSFYSYAVKVATRGGPGRGNEYRIDGGAGRVAGALAAELGERVRCYSPVTELRRETDRVEVRWIDEEGAGVAHARHVVLAIPFTCCRDILFWPPLPRSARSMITCSVYGAVRKMHFIFDDVVEASTFTVTDTSLGYCGAAQGGGIVSFCGGRPLLAELGRPAQERKERALGLLRELYRVAEPVAVVEMVWTGEYWTRGSYMIMSPGDMAGFGEAMGGSFGRVHLAGAEGYAAAPSFMNSAVRSGLRAARQVMEELGAVRR